MIRVNNFSLIMAQRPNLLRMIVGAFFIIGIWCGYQSLVLPPAPHPHILTSPVRQSGLNPPEVMLQNTWKHLLRIAQRPHPVGSLEHDEVRNYLIGELKKLNLSPHIHKGHAAVNVLNKTRSAFYENIWVHFPGKQSTGTLIFMAHYDSVPESPGASDDGSGTASLLSLAELISKNSELRPLQNDILIVWTDAEELGMLGAQALAQTPPWSAPIPHILFNFEARGSGGPLALFETSDQSGSLLQIYSQSEFLAAGSSFVAGLARILPNDTDFTLFKLLSSKTSQDSTPSTPNPQNSSEDIVFPFQGLNFAFAENLSHYHSQEDNLENLDKRSLFQEQNVLKSLFDNFSQRDLQRLLVASESTTFFHLNSRWMVHYPTFGAWIFQIILSIGLFWFTLKSVQGKSITWIGLIPKFLLLFVTILISAIGFTFLIQFTQWVIGHFYAREVLLENSNRIFVLELVLTYLIFSFLKHFISQFSKSLTFQQMLFHGSLILNYALAVFCLWKNPPMAFLFQWPTIALFASTLLFDNERSNANLLGREGLRFLLLAIFAFFSAYFVASQVWTFHILDGGLRPAIPGFFLFTLGTLLWPFRSFLASRSERPSSFSYWLFSFGSFGIFAFLFLLPQATPLDNQAEAINFKPSEDSRPQEIPTTDPSPKIIRIPGNSPPSAKLNSGSKQVLEYEITSLRKGPCLHLEISSPSPHLALSKINDGDIFRRHRFGPRMDPLIWSLMAGKPKFEPDRANTAALKQTHQIDPIVYCGPLTPGLKLTLTAPAGLDPQTIQFQFSNL